MFLELTEVLVCPRCRPAQGLIALVDEIADRRVRRGALGCPECEARYPVTEGLVRFGESGGEGESGDVGSPGTQGTPDGGTPGPDPAEMSLLEDVGEEEGATRLAALLGAREAEGHLMLGPGLARWAGRLAGMVEEGEVVVVAPDPGAEGPGDDAAVAGTGVTRLSGVDPAGLPVVSGRLGGAVLVAPGKTTLEEGTRVLRRGARLVVLEPTPETRSVLEALPLEVAADDARALVAVRGA